MIMTADISITTQRERKLGTKPDIYLHQLLAHVRDPKGLKEGEVVGERRRRKKKKMK